MQYLDAGCCPQNLREHESHRGRWTETACTGTSITISDFPTLGKSAKQNDLHGGCLPGKIRVRHTCACGKQGSECFPLIREPQRPLKGKQDMGRFLNGSAVSCTAPGPCS